LSQYFVNKLTSKTLPPLIITSGKVQAFFYFSTLGQQLDRFLEQFLHITSNKHTIKQLQAIWRSGPT
tara:strand:- start:213 stop:413 length:201 start_codon:yes stop_codon:yes gene_type:complete